MRPTPLLIPVGVLLALSACADNELSSREGAADYGDTGYWDGDSAPGSEDGDTGNDWGSEQEDDFLKLRPATTPDYVFVANAERDTISRITVPGLEVITVEVGTSPAAVETTTDDSHVVVFNEGSDDVSIVDADALTVETVEVNPHLNALVLSDDGEWAIVYRDDDVEDEEDGGGGAKSFNEISIVNTGTLEHFSEVVGFSPRQVKFTDDSEQALVVADEYLTIIDLSGAEPDVTAVEIAEDLIDPPKAEEIVVSPSGDFAFLRQFGEDDIVVVDLITFGVDRIPVGANPTDLDLTPDGDWAVVVSRGSNELWILDALDPTALPSSLALPDDELIGSIQFSPDGTKAILYTTAAPIAHFTSWDLSTDEFDVRPLVKPVDNVAISPDGRAMLVFHTLEDAEDADPSSDFYGEWAASMISLEDFRRNALLLEAEPSAYANSDDGNWGFFIMEEQPYLEVLNYDQLDHEELALKSDPVHVGVLPSTTYAFVNQEHDLGRLSFYEAETQILETITGFELNAGIEH